MTDELIPICSDLTLDVRDAYQREHSLSTHNMLPGTVKPVRVWYLLEYKRMWPHAAVKKAAEEDTPFGRWVAAANKPPHSRVILVRQTGPNAPTPNSLRLRIAVADERSPALYGFDFTHYEALPRALDEGTRAALLAGEPVTGLHGLDERLFIVCTNTHHDACCGSYGHNVYSAMQRAAPEGYGVWQASHIGGHRLAPTGIAFPEGAVYGLIGRSDERRANRDRLDPTADAEAIIKAHRSGRLYAPRLRGRACHPQPVQAAEQALWERGLVATLGDYHLQSVEQTGKLAWQVRFSGINRAFEVRKVEHGVFPVGDRVERGQMVGGKEKAIHSFTVQ